MFYQQISHIGDEQKRSTNLKRVYNTRYQTQYNIRYLAKVKGYYYFNHRTKEYMHHNW